MGGGHRDAKLSGDEDGQRAASFGAETAEWPQLGKSHAHGLHNPPSSRHGAHSDSAVRHQYHPERNVEVIQHPSGE